MPDTAYRANRTITKTGLALQEIARHGSEQEFITKFIAALQQWARKKNIPKPEELTANLLKRRIRCATGATEDQVARLYERVRTELGVSVVHSSRECDTFGTMAVFYHRHLRQKAGLSTP